MSYEKKQYEIKEPKESLHWINFTTGKVLKELEKQGKELENISGLLRQLRDKDVPMRKSIQGDDIPF
jgi:hypothetical protein